MALAPAQRPHRPPRGPGRRRRRCGPPGGTPQQSNGALTIGAWPSLPGHRCLGPGSPGPPQRAHSAPHKPHERVLRQGHRTRATRRRRKAPAPAGHQAEGTPRTGRPATRPLQTDVEHLVRVVNQLTLQNRGLRQQLAARRTGRRWSAFCTPSRSRQRTPAIPWCPDGGPTRCAHRQHGRHRGLRAAGYRVVHVVYRLPLTHTGPGAWAVPGARLRPQRADTSPSAVFGLTAQVRPTARPPHPRTCEGRDLRGDRREDHEHPVAADMICR